jgi:hypothetical protein
MELTRRAAMLATAGLALAAAPPPAAAQGARVTGTVRDPAGAGIAGVMVSNGIDVALSDAAGAWTLPVEPGQSVFVIKPTGGMVPIDPQTQLPQFAVPLPPASTPDFRFAGIPPAPLPDRIDFTLRRQEEPTSFEALLFTDPQPESLAELGFIRDDVVAQVDTGNAAFGITTGDVMFDDLAWYERSNRIIGTLGIPWWHCCGNHDMNFDAPDNKLSRETFRAVYGARHAAFQYGGALFFLLDNVDYHGHDPARPNGGGIYRGFFGAAQLAFVRNVLAHIPTDALVVYCFHIPLRTLAGTDPGNSTVDVADFLAAISTHPNSFSFCGHTHTNEHYELGAADGFTGGTHHHHVMAAVSGSWWSGPFDERGIPVAVQVDGCPNGHHVLSVEGATCRTRFVPARDPEHSPMRLMLDAVMHREVETEKDYPMGALLRGPLDAASVGATFLLANIYDGGPRTKVSLRIGADGALMAMTRTVRMDPFVQELYSRNIATKKPWVQPGLSSHIWQVRLPPRLPPGTHRLVVQATDRHGRASEAAMILEIV